MTQMTDFDSHARFGFGTKDREVLRLRLSTCVMPAHASAEVLPLLGSDGPKSRDVLRVGGTREHTRSWRVAALTAGT